MSISNVTSTQNWWYQQYEAMQSSQSSPSGTTGTSNSNSTASVSNTGTTASPVPFFVDFASDLQAMLAQMSGTSGAASETSSTSSATTTATTTANTATDDQTSSVNGTHHHHRGGGDRSIQGDATQLVGEAAQTMQNSAGGTSNVATADLPELRGRIETLRPPQAADAYWASIFGGLPASGPLASLVIERLHRRFCVGYELPPWLVRVLHDGLVPYLDLRLHPLRFLDDVMFAARTSCGDTHAAMFSMAVNEAEVIATAGLREAMCRFISEARVPDDTLLVVGQRPFDSSQIVNAVSSTHGHTPPRSTRSAHGTAQSFSSPIRMTRGIACSPSPRPRRPVCSA
jgi:hypothetical protein